MTNEPFVIERTYNAPIEKVWKAITDKDQMKKWYFDMPAFQPVVGTEFTFEGCADDKNYLHVCIVKEVIEGRKLSYSWRYDGHEGDSLVTFELFPEGSKTRLKLTHSGLETFPKDDPNMARASFAAGWTEIIGKLLPQFVEPAFLNYTLVLDAGLSVVWDLITQHELIREWASAFDPGTTIETTWQIGSLVSWFDGAGNIGAKGIVETFERERELSMRYFDDVEETDPAKLGEYRERFVLSEENGKTKLEIISGPLSRKDADFTQPMWDKALEKLEQMAVK